eukprot:TRINITY_DN14223_c0_g1_i1.p1 TRINITY_DN14223_c0_g1~~TRINITY_DN14223_c0_g1_i1.p1  ORF type:complete len:559 (-),score=92.77 TRINITY_DN14223_c0_g1_i1:3-1556(-)
MKTERIPLTVPLGSALIRSSGAIGAVTELWPRLATRMQSERRRGSFRESDHLWAHNSAMQAFVAHSRPTEMLGVFAALQRAGLRPDATTLSILVKGLSEADRFAEALEFWQRFTAKSADAPLLEGPISTQAFNVMLAACARARRGDQLVAVAKQMVASSTRPDLYTWSVLLHHFLHNGSISRIQNLFDDIDGATELVIPIQMHLSLIGALALLGDLPRLKRYWSRLRGRGVGPTGLNVRTYTALLDGFGKLKHLETVDEIAAHMKTHGVPPNEATHSVLLRIAGNGRRDPNAVLTLWREMQREYSSPNPISHLIALQACSDSGTSKTEQVAIWDSLNSLPDVHPFYCLSAIKFLGSGGTNEPQEQLQAKAAALFENALALPDDAHASHRKDTGPEGQLAPLQEKLTPPRAELLPEPGSLWVDDAVVSLDVPVPSLANTLNAYVEICHSADVALHALERAKTRCRPNGQTCLTICTLLLKEGRPAEARRLHTQMVASGTRFSEFQRNAMQLLLPPIPA